MSAAKVRVEGSGGTDLGDMAKDMVRLAGQLQLDVIADFNGVALMIHPGDAPESLVDAYWRAIEVEKKCEGAVMEAPARGRGLAWKRTATGAPAR